MSTEHIHMYHIGTVNRVRTLLLLTYAFKWITFWRSTRMTVWCVQLWLDVFVLFLVIEYDRTDDTTSQYETRQHHSKREVQKIKYMHTTIYTNQIHNIRCCSWSFASTLRSSLSVFSTFVAVASMPKCDQIKPFSYFDHFLKSSFYCIILKWMGNNGMIKCILFFSHTQQCL